MMELLQFITNGLAYLFAIVAVFVASVFGIFVPHKETVVPAPVAVAEETQNRSLTKPVEPTPKPQTRTQTPTAVKPIVPQLPTQLITPAPALPTKNPEEINQEARAALVNILCRVSMRGLIYEITGSGVLVDSRGVVLTNAHIGQFFLLENYPNVGSGSCTVRTGSPAQSRYTARLLFLPPSWIIGNASQITSQQAAGTGEADFAFLQIVGTTDPQGTLPSEFPHLKMKAVEPTVGESVLVAAYPAGFLSSEFVQKALYASSAFAQVVQLFSFHSSPNVELFGVSGTVASQAGSSGGAIVNSNSELIGLVATATLGATTGERQLRALTLYHIDDSLAGHGQGGIGALLAGNISAKADAFNENTAPTLTQKLISVLEGR